MKPIAARIEAMPPSGIREIMTLADATPGVIRLVAGEPNFATPDHILEAAAQAGRDGYTKYTSNRGILELREAIVTKLEDRNGFTVDTEQIVVTLGDINGIISSLLALVDPGEAILIPDPSWPNYVSVADIVGAEVVRFPLLPGSGYLPDIEALDRICASTPNAKAIVINSPSNPTGAVYDVASTEAVLEIAARHDLYLISDECYDEIVFDGEHISPASLDDSGRVVSVYSVSKTYAMTGWRIGYVAANEHLTTMMCKTQEGMVSCPVGVAQKAAQAALEGDQSCVAEMRDAYKARRDRVLPLLEEAGILLSRPHGAFYVMVDTSATGMNGYDIARRLVAEHGVAIAPGETFGPGGEGTIRLSLATGMDDLLEGVGRVTKALEDWSW
ncbi:pyridoxal phosphate-dependent aminotransferase [bacterium]|nr:pyridoxal phosphate-dependent aminotransferase [bacterium]